MDFDHRLIVALDVTNPKGAVALAASVRPHVDAVKIGWPLVLAGGLDVIRTLSKSGYVLCDFKIADIPTIDRLIVEQAVTAGASGVICHGFTGEDAVRSCIEAAKGTDVFVVTEMSHPGAAEFTAKHAEDIARLAVRAHATGIIAPATRPERVKTLRAIVGVMQILSPGVGAQGGRAADAIAAGADAVIVGRAICESADPAAAAKAVGSEIRSAIAR